MIQLPKKKILCFWQQFKLLSRACLSISLSHLQGKGSCAAREKWHHVSAAKAHNAANYPAPQRQAGQNQELKEIQVSVSLPQRIMCLNAVVSWYVIGDQNKTDYPFVVQTDFSQEKAIWAKFHKNMH